MLNCLNSYRCLFWESGMMLLNCGAGEDSWESLDRKIKPVNPKGNQPWIFIGRTDAEALVLWPHDVNSEFIGKDPNVGNDGRWKKKRVKEDEMAGGHHQLNGHEFGQTPGNSGGQESLVCCCPWGCRKSNMTMIDIEKVNILPLKSLKENCETSDFKSGMQIDFRLSLPILK